MARATVMVLAATLALLLLLASSSAARPGPAAEATVSGGVDPPPRHRQSAAADVESAGCEGANAVKDDDCMARRTLAAHTDYIYTQEHHN